MKTKYQKYTLKGDHSEQDAQRALGESAAQGVVVRIDRREGQTHVYVATQETGGAAPPKTDGPQKATPAVKGQDVGESDILKLG